MEKYQDDIIEMCDEYGVDPSVLTESDKKKLIEEIEVESRREFFTDSVLMDVLMREPK